MMASISPVVAKFSEYTEGKITREEAILLFYDFMQKTLPPQLRPTKELATSIVKSPMTGFANIPQVMSAMVILLQQ